MEKYPNRKISSHVLFTKLHERPCKTGPFKIRHRDLGKPDMEIQNSPIPQM